MRHRVRSMGIAGAVALLAPAAARGVNSTVVTCPTLAGHIATESVTAAASAQLPSSATFTTTYPALTAAAPASSVAVSAISNGRFVCAYPAATAISKAPPPTGMTCTADATMPARFRCTGAHGTTLLTCPNVSATDNKDSPGWTTSHSEAPGFQPTTASNQNAPGMQCQTAIVTTSSQPIPSRLASCVPIVGQPAFRCTVL